MALLTATFVSAAYAAWLCDDYLIGLRQIVNLTRGHGFSFNTGVRVQTMTSPLWGLLLVPVYLISDGWYGPLVLSLGLSLGAVVVFARQGFDKASARGPILAGLAVLLLSKGFMDFTTSGLENPLAYAVASAFCCLLVRDGAKPTSPTFNRLCALAGVLFLVRYDYVLLVAPALLWWAIRLRNFRALLRGSAALGAVIVPWLVFSLVYYGTLFSNSYYAKVTTQIPEHDLLQFGFMYWWAMVLHDPVTLYALGAGILVALTPRATGATRVLMLGVLAYCAYVTVIGGDFMLGRFLSVGVLTTAFAVVDTLRARSSGGLFEKGLLVAAAGVALLGPGVPAFSTYFTRQDMERHHARIEIVPRFTDEKNAYVGERGLLTGWKRFEPWLRERLAARNNAAAPVGRVIVVDCGGLGWMAFDAGMDAHVFDRCALADPFLSKLPLYDVGQQRVLLGWGPGHYSRVVPPGYVESLAQGRNLISDPVLARTFDDIRLIASGPLFSRERWAAIGRLSTGATVLRAASAPAYAGIYPASPAHANIVRYEDMARVFFTHCMWEYSNRVIQPGHALSILFPRALSGGKGRISVQPDVDYRLEFYAKGRPVGEQYVRLPPACPGTAIADGPVVLEPAKSKSFDRLDIVPVGTHDAVGIGGFYLEEASRGSPPAPLAYRAADVPGLTGQKLPNGARAAVVGRDGVGHLMFGPYAHLGAGPYQVRIPYVGGRPVGDPNGSWDVILWEGKEEQRLGGGALLGTGGAERDASASISVPISPPEAVIEVRVLFDESGDLTVRGASIEPVERPGAT